MTNVILECATSQGYPLDVTCPAQGWAAMIFDRATMPQAAEALESAACLAVRASSLDEHSVCLQLAFYEAGQLERGDEPTMRAVFGLLPHTDVVVPFDLQWLDGQTLFAPRTLGRLKTTIFGKSIRRRDIDRIVLSSTPSFAGQPLRIASCKLLDTMPEITIAREPLVDELGQWKPKDWPGKIADRAQCTAVLRELAGNAEDDAGYGFEAVSGSTSIDLPDTEAAADGPNAVTSLDPAGAYSGFAGWDRYGGYTGKRFAATGWFRVERDSTSEDAGQPGRFWLVDPDGNAFISTGVDCVGMGVETRVDPVRPWLDERVAGLLDTAIREAGNETGDRDGDSQRGRTIADPDFRWHADPHGCGGVTASYDYGTANLRAAFGDDARAAWERITRRHLHSWGVNTIGNWSDPVFIRNAGIPYVLPADSLSEAGFPSTGTMLFRDFPDVFADEYERRSREYARGLLPWRNDRNMIGYFMRNEPNWAFVYDLNIAEEMLANPHPLASKYQFVAWLRERYHDDVTAWNTAWGLGDGVSVDADAVIPVGTAGHAITPFANFDEVIARSQYRIASRFPGCTADLQEFSRILIDRYVRIPAEALREVDPHHLNLGMRYAYITDETLLAGSDCYDVFSINSYQRTCLEQVDNLGRLLDMPVMVGEFHHGALDRGLTAHGIRGVTTQAERGVAYRYYVEQALRSPYFVGAHYFQYNDQSPLGRFDGENYQIGLVDVCMQEYREMADAMRDCHAGIYQVAMGARAPFSRLPEEVNPIHY